MVCGGIHMSEIPAFPYSLLWGERTIRSVANLTRKDGRFSLSRHVPYATLPLRHSHSRTPTSRYRGCVQVS